MRDSSTAQAQRELAKRSVLARCIFMIIGWCISLHTHARIASYAHSPCRRCESSVVSRLRHTSPLATLACLYLYVAGWWPASRVCLLALAADRNRAAATKQSSILTEIIRAGKHVCPHHITRVIPGSARARHGQLCTRIPSKKPASPLTTSFCAQVSTRQHVYPEYIYK